jgi:hypothetical protein
MKKTPVILSAVLLGMPLVCSGEEGLTVLTNQPGKQLELLLMRQFNQQVDQRLEAYNAIKSRADCEKWQRERREFFIRQIGGFPERTPLKAKTVRHLKGKGYRVENVMFESRPDHFLGKLNGLAAIGAFSFEIGHGVPYPI